MPVELLDGQRLQVVLDFAPRLIPPTTNAAAKSGTPSAAAALGGAGVNGRKPRRVGVLLARDSLVTDLRGKRYTALGVCGRCKRLVTLNLRVYAFFVRRAWAVCSVRPCDFFYAVSRHAKVLEG